jgi:transcription elongation factor Elf1
MAASKRKPRPNAVWNEHPFTCPGCGRNWGIAQIRICTLYGKWHCQACRDTALDRVVRTAGKITPTDASQTCRTCHLPFGSRRAVTNVHGDLVHYRCPKKRRAPST